MRKATSLTQAYTYVGIRYTHIYRNTQSKSQVQLFGNEVKGEKERMREDELKRKEVRG